MGFSITSQLLVLSLSVIDVDIATSAFLARRYSGSLRRMRPGLRSIWHPIKPYHIM